MAVVYVRAGLGVFNCAPEGSDRVFHANSLSVLTSRFFRSIICKALEVDDIEFRLI